MSLAARLGHLLYKVAFPIYRPLYAFYKTRSDAFELAQLREHVRPGDVVLDIGANIGFYSRILSDLVGPNGKVHCFEPDRQNFHHLEEAARGLSNLTINFKAVAPSSGKLKIYTSKSYNVDHRTYEPEQYDQAIEIDAISMDDYIGDGRVDFIKMDIQGFEMEAVRGMEGVLARNPNIKILSEFWPYGLRKAGSSTSAYYRYLSDRGFGCYLLKDNSLARLSEADAVKLDSLGQASYFNLFARRQG